MRKRKWAWIGIVLLLAGGWVGEQDYHAAEITAKHEAEARARKAIRPNELCITQYGPGERWISSQPPVCANAALAVPSYVLSMPVKQ